MKLTDQHIELLRSIAQAATELAERGDANADAIYPGVTLADMLRRIETELEDLADDEAEAEGGGR